MSNEQSLALILADEYERGAQQTEDGETWVDARLSAELRRLHAAEVDSHELIDRLRSQRDAVEKERDALRAALARQCEPVAYVDKDQPNSIAWCPSVIAGNPGVVTLPDMHPLYA